MKEKFQKEVITCFGGAFLIMFMIGIYFVYVPWNIDRLDITESELGISICAFGFANLFANQLGARVIVPKIGTTNTIILGIFIFSYLPLAIASAPNYFFFTLFFIPIGIYAILCIIFLYHTAGEYPRVNSDYSRKNYLKYLYLTVPFMFAVIEMVLNDPGYTESSMLVFVSMVHHFPGKFGTSRVWKITGIGFAFFSMDNFKVSGV